MTQNEFILLISANALVSFSMLAIGINSYLRARSFLASAIETKGTAIEMVKKGQSKSGSTMYSPKIRFTDRTGQIREFTEKWSGSPPDFKIGDELIVLYPPDNPEKARRGGQKWKFFFVAWLIGGLGLLFSGLLVAAVVVMLIFGIPSK
jgi:hypothetical protein